MKDRVWMDRGEPLQKWTNSEFEALARPMILLVEDDDDTREMLVTLLDIAGFNPTACRTAEEALEQLREQHFDLVLTDYMLPNRSGAWLLNQASNEGLLEATPAIVVTAHPSPPDVESYEIVCKPFDLDELVERVKWRLEQGSGDPMPKPTSRKPRKTSGGSGGDGDGDCREPIELILYVTKRSERSAVAIDSIRDVLSRYKPSRVKLTICDLDEASLLDGLSKRTRGPRTFILGHITNPELLLELLEGCED